MKFTTIDMNNYPRREHYLHYRRTPCTYSLTAQLNVTALLQTVKIGKFKLNPTLIYLITRAVNQIRELKMGLNENGELGFYDQISASYLIFHNDDKTFSEAYTQFNDNFVTFYNAIIDDTEKFADVKGYTAIEAPMNSFPISTVPWVAQTGVNLNLSESSDYFAPIITCGKYESYNGELKLPISLQVNHAVCDGYHASLFFKQLQEVIDIFSAAQQEKQTPQILQTPRLYLREMTQSDYNSLSKMLKDPDVMYAYEGAFTDIEIQAWLDNQQKRYEEQGYGLWAVILKETGEMIGQCGLTNQNVNDKEVIEVGYLFQKAYWHNGYATEAAMGCKEYAFARLKAKSVYSIVRDTNVASQQVAIRNGMTKTGAFMKTYKGIDMPHLVYQENRG